MEQNYISLSYMDIVLASGLVLFAGIISLLFRLKLGKKLLIGATRTIVQLGIAAVALSTVFGLKSLWLVLLLAFLMMIMAGREAIRRQKIKPRGISLDIIFAMTLSGFTVSVVVTGVVVGADPWWHPPVFIPLLGMILGNSLNGISITLDRFLSACTLERERIETRLVLGATPNEAVQPMVQEAIRAGMFPIINAMAIVGVVSLPGMMTGQLLAGADPRDAVMYQVVVMYMLAASTALASMVAVLLVRRRVFNKDMALVNFPQK